MANTNAGGWSEPKDIGEIQKICDQMSYQVKEKTGINYVDFRAVQYRNQIVQGENFLIKVYVGGVDYIHLSVYQKLPCDGGQVVLCGVQQGKKKEDPLNHFPY